MAPTAGASGASSSSSLYDILGKSHRIVAQFLADNGYSHTLDAFSREASKAGWDVAEDEQEEPTVTEANDSLTKSEGGQTASRKEPVFDLRTLVESYLSQLAAIAKQSAQDATANSVASSSTAPLSVTLPGPPTLPYELKRTHRTVHASNILSLALVQRPVRTFDTRADPPRFVTNLRQCLASTGADKRIVLTDWRTGEVEEMLEGPHMAAVLAVAQHPKEPRIIASAGMDAKVVIWDLMTRQPLQEFKDHSKFVVRTAFSPSGTFLASASYDRRILIYRSTCPSSSSSQRQREGGNGDDEEDDVEVRPLGTRYERVHEVQLHANPEAILFVRAPASPPAAPAAVATSTTAQTLAATSSAAAPDSRSRTWLAYTVRGDCHLYYLALPLDADVETDAHAPGSGPFGSDGGAADGKDGAEPQTVGSSDADGESSLVNDWTVLKFNTNANPLDTHVSYSLLSLALHPSGQYISLQTGDHAAPSSTSAFNDTTLPGSLSRILLLPLLSSTRAATLWTGVEGGSYASPRQSWLPSGAGVWVSSEDGTLRLIDLSGRVRAAVWAHGRPSEEELREMPEGEARTRLEESRRAAVWSRGGNTVVKDVCVLPDEEGVASVGFDRTMRIVCAS